MVAHAQRSSLLQAVRISWALCAVPQLFFSLLFWPLIAGIIFAACQLSFTQYFIRTTTETPDQFRERIQSSRTTEAYREVLLSEEELRELADKQVKVCQWTTVGDAETPPEGCELDPTDLVFRVAAPTEFSEKLQLSEVIDSLRGLVRRVHLCRECSSDIMIVGEVGSRKIETRSLKALSLLSVAEEQFMSGIVEEYYGAGKEVIYRFKEGRGKLSFYLSGLDRWLNVTDASRIMILVINASFIIVIGLWMALRAHRRVLDYFAKNNALLPLVAACGKKEFYLALWLITYLRVGSFLFAVIPGAVVVAATMVDRATLLQFIGEPVAFLLWLFALICGLLLVTLFASVAELMQRVLMVGFIYRYLPFLLWVLGMAIWVWTVLSPFFLSDIVQKVVMAVPLIGLGPVLLFPLTRAGEESMVIHALLALMGVLYLMRYNARWFGAHLEEL